MRGKENSNVDVVNVFFNPFKFQAGPKLSQQQQEASRQAYDATTNNKYSNTNLNSHFNFYTIYHD